MLKRWSYLVALALVANLALAAGPQANAARACSCAGASSTEESFRRADAVFSGEVAEVCCLTPSEREPKIRAWTHSRAHA